MLYSSASISAWRKHPRPGGVMTTTMEIGMTKNFHQRRAGSRRLAWMFFLVPGLINSDRVGASDNDTGSTVPQLNMTIWQAIDALARQIPFTKDKIEKVLGIALQTESNDKFVIPPKSFHPYVGERIQLDGGVVIEDVDFRISHRRNDPGFLVIHVAGACIGLASVRSNYRDLTITGHPRGRSLDEATAYSSSLGWGRLSFGFRERNPDCVASVSFDPEKKEVDVAN